MSIEPPPLVGAGQLNVGTTGFPAIVQPFPNITPFTYRDGMSWAETLEDYQRWILTALVPHVDTQSDSIVAAYNFATGQLAAAMTAFEVGSNDTTEATAADRAAAEAAAAASATTAGNAATAATAATAAAQAAKDAKDAAAATLAAVPTTNDPIVYGLVGNAQSATRAALNGLYAQTPTADVYALGDSIINGVGPSAGKDPIARARVYLAQYLGKAFSIVNGGVPGDTTGAMLQRLPAMLAAYHPRIVTISATVNDLRYDITAPNNDTIGNIRTMVGLCRMAGALPIIVTNTPFNTTNFAGAYNQASVNARPGQVAAVRALATELRVPIADVDLAFANATDYATNYTVDGLHPTDVAANGWGRVIASAIAARAALTNFGAPAIVDDFNRADSSTVLGSTSVGAKPWQFSGGGVWGINGNAAALIVGGGEPVAYIDDSNSDGTVSMTVKVLASGYLGLVFRRSDNSNYWMLWINANGKWALIKRVNGGYGPVSEGPTAVANDVGSVEFNGSSIVAKVNGQQILTVTDAFNASATSKGLWIANNTVVRVDNFSAQASI